MQCTGYTVINDVSERAYQLDAAVDSGQRKGATHFVQWVWLVTKMKFRDHKIFQYG